MCWQDFPDLVRVASCASLREGGRKDGRRFAVDLSATYET